MGSEHAKQQAKQDSEEVVKVNHQRFQRYKYIPTDDLLEITVDVPEEKEMKTWETDVTNSINGFQNRDSLLLPLKHEYQPKGWCGNTGSVKIYYEHFPYLFSEEIENRISMGKYFEEEELWYLLYSLVGCAKDFWKVQKKIGDVRPHNIFINEEGQIKIANVFSWPYERTNFEKTAYENVLTYISPEQMNLLEKGNFQNKTNRVVSQSFSIGLTMLESGLLFNASELYSVSNRSVDKNKLNNKIAQWMGLEFTTGEGNGPVSYSPLLKNIVASLCQAEPEQRAISFQIEDLLRPYQNQIMNLKFFEKKSIDFHPAEALGQRQSRQSKNQEIFSYSPVSAVPPQQFQQQVQQGQQVQQYQQVQHIPQLQQVQQQVQQVQAQQLPPQQQQVFTIPSQTYRVANNIEPKSLATNYPPPQQVYRPQQFQAEQIKVTQQHVNFTKVANPSTQTGYREVFNKFAANQPERQNPPVVISQQNYQQQFLKYANINQQPIQINNNTTTIQQQQQHVQLNKPFTQSYTSPQTNTFNIPNVATTEFNSNGQFLNASNFQQSQYVNNGVQYATSTVSQFVPAPSSNDFLKKIDQQLQNSRKLYPS